SNSPTLAVYIEGDGHAWSTKYRLSSDPTPRDPVALRLAVQDPSPAVLYIARPCQYTTDETRQGCHPNYWSSHRYAEEVINAVNLAISQALAGSPATSVGLVGYSGGAAVAALVAARRNDVEWLITVAGNLDHAAWTRLHSITPLYDSLNPADFTHRLQSIPQLHLVGTADRNVPAAVTQAYTSRFTTPSSQIRTSIIPGFGHHCCWAEDWKELLCRHQFRGQPACTKRQ
ncbi:MAG: alpha/beta hydrolase, partial [Gammaproteobacteria bacterium]|nr:alpha/beta hydrolase [Gammaproteobacteria bacterium]